MRVLPGDVEPPRKRGHLFVALVGIIVVGWASRQPFLPPGSSAVGASPGDAFFFPPWIGDVLYATMSYVGVLFLRPWWSWRRAAAVAVAYCFAIEFSQLWSAEILLALRRTRLGALVLGRGFLWEDLVAYVGGVALGTWGDPGRGGRDTNAASGPE